MGNFFNEGINWANIGTELSNTNRYFLLTDVNIDNVYKKKLDTQSQKGIDEKI